MKSKLLLTSLSLIATSAYAQSSMPSGDMLPPTVRAEMPRAAMPSMPQPAMQRPVQSNPASRSVGAVPVNPQEQENIARMITLPPTQPAVGASGGAGGNGGLLVGNGGNGGNGATPKPSVTMYNGVGPLPANVVRAPTPVGASQSATQAQVEAVVQDRKAQAQSNAQYRKSDAQTNAQEKLAPYYTGDVDVPSWSGYPPSHPALGGKLEEVIYVAAPVTPTTVGATGVRTPTPPMPADDAKGPTSVVDGVIESVAQSKEAAIESFLNNVENLEVRN